MIATIAWAMKMVNMPEMIWTKQRRTSLRCIYHLKEQLTIFAFPPVNYLGFSDTFLMVMWLYNQIQYHLTEVFKFRCWKHFELRGIFSGLAAIFPSASQGKDYWWVFRFSFISFPDVPRMKHKVQVVIIIGIKPTFEKQKTIDLASLSIFCHRTAKASSPNLWLFGWLFKYLIDVSIPSWILESQGIFVKSYEWHLKEDFSCLILSHKRLVCAEIRNWLLFSPSRLNMCI